MEYVMSEPEPLDGVDATILDGVRAVYDSIDPMPAGLVDRVIFALASGQLAAEIARLEPRQPVAARSAQRTRTMTFEAESLTIMVTLTEVAGGQLRLDGWLAPAASLRVELRRASGSDTATADETGRFVFPAVDPSLVQLLVFRDDPHSPWIVTPAVEL
jgi:hypothetical protein